MGIIKECGGKMYLSEKKWDLALDELFECFKNYQESGNIKAKDILVYVILASMLCQSSINHAETREAKVYKEDKTIIAINSLRSAYEKNEIVKIQAILGNKQNKIFNDPEFSQYLDDLLRNIRLNVLEVKVLPYTSVKISFLAKEVNITENEIR